MAEHGDFSNLRVLLANQEDPRLDVFATIVQRLGHVVVARQRNVEGLAEATRRERPDVALIGLGESDEHALGLIRGVVQEAACPVILVLDGPDPAFVREAAKSGIFAYVTVDDSEREDVEGTLEIVLRRFAEYHNLEGAFGRRAVIEMANGILMERHQITERRAFELMRDHSRASNRRVADIAQAIVDGFLLLPSAGRPAPARDSGPDLV